MDPDYSTLRALVFYLDRLSALLSDTAVQLGQLSKQVHEFIEAYGGDKNEDGEVLGVQADEASGKQV